MHVWLQFGIKFIAAPLSFGRWAAILFGVCFSAARHYFLGQVEFLDPPIFFRFPANRDLFHVLYFVKMAEQYLEQDVVGDEATPIAVAAGTALAGAAATGVVAAVGADGGGAPVPEPRRPDGSQARAGDAAVEGGVAPGAGLQEVGGNVTPPGGFVNSTANPMTSRTTSSWNYAFASSVGRDETPWRQHGRTVLLLRGPPRRGDSLL